VKIKQTSSSDSPLSTVITKAGFVRSLGERSVCRYTEVRIRYTIAINRFLQEKSFVCIRFDFSTSPAVDLAGARMFLDFHTELASAELNQAEPKRTIIDSTSANRRARNLQETARAKVNDSPRELDLEYQARKGRLSVVVKGPRTGADSPKCRWRTEPGSFPLKWNQKVSL
jgi:hypothetical protein